MFKNEFLMTLLGAAVNFHCEPHPNGSLVSLPPHLSEAPIMHQSVAGKLLAKQIVNNDMQIHIRNESTDIIRNAAVHGAQSLHAVIRSVQSGVL